VPRAPVNVTRDRRFLFFKTDLPCKDTLHAELAQGYSLLVR